MANLLHQHSIRCLQFCGFRLRQQQSNFRTNALNLELVPRTGGGFALGRPRPAARRRPGSPPPRSPRHRGVRQHASAGAGGVTGPFPRRWLQAALPFPRKPHRPPRGCQTARRRSQARRGPRPVRSGGGRPPGPALLSPQTGPPPRPTPRAARAP